MHPLLPLSLLLSLFLCAPAHAQLLADTVFTWQGYGQRSHCRLRLYAAPEPAERPHVVVLQELADNAGASTLDEAAHLAELVGRHFSLDPEQATFVFHWGPFSYADARPERRKELFLRATFRHTSGGRLGSPSWRLLTREEVEAYTDRLFR